MLYQTLQALFLVIAFTVNANYAWAEKTHIVWFSTLNADTTDKSGFWKRVHDLTLAAAEDLDLRFEVYYAEENYVLLKQQVSKVLEDPTLRPDGIIFHNYKLTGETILRQAEVFGVKSMLFNSGLQSKDAIEPRVGLKHWVGEVLPDDVFAGSELLRHLKLAAARINPGKETHTVVAMAGNPSSAAYQARERGLLSEIESDSALEFQQFVPADWSRAVAQKQFPVLIRRYPETKIYWAANDNMALGLLDASEKLGLVPGQDFITGGIDWLPEALKRVSNGDMEASVGGHFVEGMWALILLYDYLNGHDFKEDLGTQIRTKMFALTKENLAGFGDIGAKLTPEALEAVDFSLLSHTDNPKLKSYPFDIGQFLNFISAK